MSEVEFTQPLVQMQRDQSGQEVVSLKLNRDHYETLKVLFESGAWKLYRQILLQAKEGYLSAALSSDNPDKAFKTIGIVAGLNFSVNQLGALMAQYNKSEKTVEGETQTIPRPKGN